MVGRISRRYPSVRFRWSNAVEAMRSVLKLPKKSPPCLRVEVDRGLLHVSSSQPIWGPQPFLAIRTNDSNYYHDNFIKEDELSWLYPFGHDSVDLETVASIGVATNDTVGNTVVVVCDMKEAGEFKVKYWNTEDWFNDE